MKLFLALTALMLSGGSAYKGRRIRQHILGQDRHVIYHSRHMVANECTPVCVDPEFASENVTPPPTRGPTKSPTDGPTKSPIDGPTSGPTAGPTDSPTGSPSYGPTRSPIAGPTPSPTYGPTSGPTSRPTDSPTGGPTVGPTDSPTAGPTRGPTDAPTESPTYGPTRSPIAGPTPSPTYGPTSGPTSGPTDSPTAGPTAGPTDSPTAGPTSGPTRGPTESPTSGPTRGPTESPTSGPTRGPTESPTPGPTRGPTESPTAGPTSGPTRGPTASPTAGPTSAPTRGPTVSPTAGPTSGPTRGPTQSPTSEPTKAPTPNIVPQNLPADSETLCVDSGPQPDHECCWHPPNKELLTVKEYGANGSFVKFEVHNQWGASTVSWTQIHYKNYNDNNNEACDKVDNTHEGDFLGTYTATCESGMATVLVFGYDAWFNQDYSGDCNNDMVKNKMPNVCYTSFSNSEKAIWQKWHIPCLNFPMKVRVSPNCSPDPPAVASPPSPSSPTAAPQSTVTSNADNSCPDTETMNHDFASQVSPDIGVDYTSFPIDITSCAGGKVKFTVSNEYKNGQISWIAVWRILNGVDKCDKDNEINAGAQHDYGEFEADCNSDGYAEVTLYSHDGSFDCQTDITGDIPGLCSPSNDVGKKIMQVFRIPCTMDAFNNRGQINFGTLPAGTDITDNTCSDLTITEKSEANNYVKWNINNSASSSSQLKTFKLTFDSADYGTIQLIKLGGNAIFKKGDSSHYGSGVASGTTIQTNEWTSTSSSKLDVSGSSTEVLLVKFTNSGTGTWTHFDLHLEFDDGCTLIYDT